MYFYTGISRHELLPSTAELDIRGALPGHGACLRHARCYSTLPLSLKSVVFPLAVTLPPASPLLQPAASKLEVHCTCPGYVACFWRTSCYIPLLLRLKPVELSLPAPLDQGHTRRSARCRHA
ncbi:hypothetical protein EVAR_8996_1 [Eumeta japonica]|uniref:Uncharacterized protein n=1 Tax=Eumeta variegata TaxID=151549 RepID=A0A4C1WSC8_EUMVA|nr:hypothetical protein EVAR_8996_1 [Eumeta japonica]